MSTVWVWFWVGNSCNLTFRILTWRFCRIQRGNPQPNYDNKISLLPLKITSTAVQIYGDKNGMFSCPKPSSLKSFKTMFRIKTFISHNAKLKYMRLNAWIDMTFAFTPDKHSVVSLRCLCGVREGRRLFPLFLCDAAVWKHLVGWLHEPHSHFGIFFPSCPFMTVSLGKKNNFSLNFFHQATNNSFIIK